MQVLRSCIRVLEMPICQCEGPHLSTDTLPVTMRFRWSVTEAKWRICSSCINCQRSILVLLCHVNQFSCEICCWGPSWARLRSIREGHFNVDLHQWEMNKNIYVNIFPYIFEQSKYVPLSQPSLHPPKINTHTYTPETRAPSGRDGWLQHTGHFQITGSDRGSFNESFVCVSSQAFQAADE